MPMRSKPKPHHPKFLPIQNIPIEKLHYDIHNIRLIHMGLSEEEQARREIWNQGDMEFLYNDIRDRGLQEELIVDNENIVVEGNRRLAVCKRLYQEQKKGQIKSPYKFHLIPCTKFSPSTPLLDIEVYLASIHVAGKKEWPDFNQTRLLYKLREERNLSIDTLADVTRRSKATILKKFEAYELTLKYHEIFPKDDLWSEKYPHFIEFLRADFEEFSENEKNVKRFMSWLESGKITNSLDIRYLKSVVDSPRALRALEKNNITEAIKIAMEYDPTIKSPTFKKIVTITKVLNNFPTKEFAKTIEEDARLKLLRELRNSVNRLITQIESVKRSDKR